MSIEAYQAVWSYKGNGFTTNLRCTLLALAEFASKYNGYTCCASVATIAEMVDTKPRQAQRNLSDLEALGLIKITPNRGRGNTNVYDLNPIMALKGVIHDLKPVIDDTFYQEENLSSMTPIIQEKVSSGTQKVSSGTLKGVMYDTQTVLTNNNHKEEYIYIAPLPESVSLMISAIAQTSGVTYADHLNGKQFEDTAYALIGNDIVPDDLQLFATWWTKNGHYSGKPAIKSILTKIKAAKDSGWVTLPKPSTNGNGSHAQTRPEIIDPTMPKPGQGGVW